MFDQIMQFAVRHWALCGAFILVLALIVIEELRAKGGFAGGWQLTPSQVTDMVNHESAVIIDVRDAAVFREGHIAGSTNISAADANKFNKYKDTQLVIVDGNGVKATQLANKLRKQGFTKVAMLRGGIDAWRRENLLLVKAKKVKNGKD